MNLRLVLVCLVAGLGIGIPDGPDIEGWIAIPRQRIQERIAEGSVDQTDGGAQGMIREFRRFGTDGPRVARPWRIAPAVVEFRPVAPTAEPAAAALPAPPQPPATTIAISPPPPLETPSFDPIEVDERMRAGLAYDLNYFGEGLGVLPRIAAPSPPPSSPVRPDELVEMAIARRGADVVRLAGRLGRELTAVAAREIARESFLAMEESPSLYFDGAIEGPKAAELAATKPQPAPEAAPSPFDMMERSDSLYFAENLVVDAPEPAAPAVDVAVELPPLPADPFAPAETIAEPAAVLAAAEAVDQAKPSSAEPPRGDVTRAVRLTSQALAAWVNVLTKPPIVAASTSSNVR